MSPESNVTLFQRSIQEKPAGTKTGLDILFGTAQGRGDVDVGGD